MGIHEDPLFAGVTRPAMAMGVTYSALLINGMTTVSSCCSSRTRRPSRPRVRAGRLRHVRHWPSISRNERYVRNARR